MSSVRFAVTGLGIISPFRMRKHNEDDKSAAIDFALSRYGIEIAETSATPVSLCSRRELSHAPA
jgi:hypothetical protein